jgi:hypothetical protein
VDERECTHSNSVARQAIWDLLAPHRERVAFENADMVEADLRRIAQSVRDDEIRLRVQGGLGPVCVRVNTTRADTVEDALAAAREEFQEKLDQLGGDDDLAELVRGATAAVDAIEAEGRELEAFRGKVILKRFHDENDLNRIFPYQAFVYELAIRVNSRPRLNALSGQAVMRIQRYVPPDLVATLEGAAARLAEVGDAPASQLAVEALDKARVTRERWEQGQPDEIDRPHMRQVLVQVARALRAHGAEDIHGALLRSAVQVGLG